MFKKGDICIRAKDFAVYTVTSVYPRLRDVGITAALDSTYPIHERASMDYIEANFFVELVVLEEGPVIEQTTYVALPMYHEDILGAGA